MHETYLIKNRIDFQNYLIDRCSNKTSTNVVKMEFPLIDTSCISFMTGDIISQVVRWLLDISKLQMIHNNLYKEYGCIGITDIHISVSDNIIITMDIVPEKYLLTYFELYEEVNDFISLIQKELQSILSDYTNDFYLSLKLLTNNKWKKNGESI